MKKLFFMIIISVFTLSLFAQDKSHEVVSEVKELTDFHEVIYQIWHTGWADKDIKLLSSIAPELEKNGESVVNAKLPGILRDKKAKWDENVKNLIGCINEYKAAVTKKDSAGLLNAAEKLHTQYEILVRIVKPKLKEIDAFHQVLYTLYHYYSPENQYEKIKEAVGQLKERVVDISKAQLSAKQKVKEESFKKLAAELSVAVDKLEIVVNEGNNKKSIQDAVENMHSKYEELEKVFD
ncbi:MAG: hypothetical protein WC055_13120 [Melioribacteraceae bacterium]